MPRLRLVPRLAVGLLVAGLSAPAIAQGPVSTGTALNAGRDMKWQVAVGTGAFVDAFLVTNNPGWVGFSGPQTARWISFNSGASNPGGSPYRFRTTFDLSGLDPTTASLTYRCAVDNNFFGYVLNGGAAVGGGAGGTGGGICGVISGFGATQTINSGFVSGVNTWEFDVTGDATTDGLIVDVQSFTASPLNSTAAPEPGTTAMLATGLLGLVGFTLRQRRRAS